MAIHSPRRILLLDHTAKWSGGEIALFRFLGALNQARYHAVVVLGEEGAFADKLRGIGIETVIEPLGGDVIETRKDSLGASGLAKKMLTAAPALLDYAKKIAEHAKRHNCVLIHTNSLKSDIYGAIAARRAKLPLLWHIRDHIAPEYLPPLSVRAMRFMAGRVPAHVVCNSRSTLFSLFAGDEAAATAPAAKKRFTVVGDCVDDSFLVAPRPEPRTTWRAAGDSRPLYIGIVGRLARWKGQHVFLEAARIVQEKWAAAGNTTALRFLIAGGALFGETGYEAEIKAQAANLPPDTVEWRGNVADVPALLAGLDVLIHASISPEPFGQVVIEGMAMGLPVIASGGGGVLDIITSGTDGVLTPMGNANALADALFVLLNGPAQATTMGQHAFDTVRARYLPERTARETEAVYDGMLS